MQPLQDDNFQSLIDLVEKARLVLMVHISRSGKMQRHTI